MEYNFEGRNILVTGSGQGIGRGIATSLAKAGAKVYALDCNKETLNDLVKEIPSIEAIHQDLECWEQTKETVSQLADLDGLVNCAGILVTGSAVDTTKEEIDAILDVNLKAAINLMQVVGKKMVLTDKGGSIVNLSSAAGIVARSSFMAYGVAKAGLDMATKVFALELGPSKVRVNSVAPAAVKTKLIQAILTDEEIKQREAVIPIGQLLDVDDVAQCVLFLLSDQSKMITGTTLVVDGGHSCYLPV